MSQYTASFVPAGICLFKVSNRNVKTMCEICSKLTRTTSLTCRSCVFIINFEQIFDCSCVSIVDFEEANAWLDINCSEMFSLISVIEVYFELCIRVFGYFCKQLHLNPFSTNVRLM